MMGSMRTFVTDRQTDRLTDGAEYIGPVGGSNNGRKYENFCDGRTDGQTDGQKGLDT